MLEARPVDLVRKIRVRVDVHHVQRSVHLSHAPSDWEADRVIPADRRDHRSAVGDRARNFCHSPMAEFDVPARDEYVAAIGHPDALEVMPLCLDIEPARTGAVRLRLAQARARLTHETRP